jgi:hypothetical protein
MIDYDAFLAQLYENAVTPIGKERSNARLAAYLMQPNPKKYLVNLLARSKRAIANAEKLPRNDAERELRAQIVYDLCEEWYALAKRAYDGTFGATDAERAPLSSILRHVRTQNELSKSEDYHRPSSLDQLTHFAALGAECIAAFATAKKSGAKPTDERVPESPDIGAVVEGSSFGMPIFAEESNSARLTAAGCVGGNGM